MELSAALVRDLGLTETEARVYLEGLGAPAARVRDLVRRTGIKRPTVYHALETLVAKGIASKRSDGAMLLFAMAPPERIGALLSREADALARREAAYAALLPQLQRKGAAAKPAGMEVSQYEGAAGVKTLVDEALYCRGRHWDIIAPRRNFFSDFDKTYARYFMETRRKRGIAARSLWERSENTERSRVLSADDLRLRQPRYLPKVMHGKFPAVVILFDDKIAMISSAKEPSGALIRSEEMHATMAAMFEGLWSVSEPYGAEKKKAS
ncbi:MAG TPA: helix-turn-helix domain-containing protein [Candidatus Eisenbacteria bacterium]|nr:helix-turn-helix domain-containing protein [Candidatus Eisenbacteria bacterium]